MTNNVHPIAELLPGMSPDQERELRLDIKKHGLLTPIVMYEGKILDGRHRARIWFDLYDGNRDVPSTAFNGTPGEAIDLVRSHNVKRRHLRPSQIAAFEAAALAFLKPMRGGRRVKGENSPFSQQSVAAKAGIDRKTIAKAVKVIRNADPAVTMSLREGKVSVDRALAISKLPKAKQLDALDGTIKVPKPKRQVRARTGALSLEIISERHPLVVAFNRGVEAAAVLLEDIDHPALAARIRTLRES